MDIGWSCTHCYCTDVNTRTHQIHYSRVGGETDRWGERLIQLTHTLTLLDCDQHEDTERGKKGHQVKFKTLLTPIQHKLHLLRKLLRYKHFLKNTHNLQCKGNQKCMIYHYKVIVKFQLAKNNNDLGT